MNDFLIAAAMIAAYILIFASIALFVTWLDNRRWKVFFDERKRQVDAQYEHDKQMSEALDMVNWYERDKSMRELLDSVNHNKQMREFFDRLNNELGTNYKYEDGMSMNDMREMFGLERV